VNRYSCVKQLEDRQASCIHLTGPPSPRRSCEERGVCMKIQARLAGIHMQEKWGGGGHLHGNASIAPEYSISCEFRHPRAGEAGRK